MSRVKQADLIAAIETLVRRVDELESHLLFFLRAQGTQEAVVSYGAENMGRLAAKIEAEPEEGADEIIDRKAGFQRRIGQIWGAAWVPPETQP